ncbi:protein of unknown function [Faunimonas pinastri]|uniref:DUF4332 domain-containing protein n=1 Tax=Faunimonas pinastri TaxID=1855383 RepID=A0A1H9PVG4_9HYPH|nr:DUF4332 domain-containing protein [Faunimonas pinastri]SER52214.1 protein of unknown function [Faunimonas pinastri]
MPSYSIADMESVGAFYASKLKAVGIRSTTALLARSETPRARKQLAEETGIPESDILRWANVADLMRVRGIAVGYAELLRAAGVDTVKALKRRNPANVVAKMTEMNDRMRLVTLLPSQQRVARWIDEAQILEPMISYREKKASAPRQD